MSMAPVSDAERMDRHYRFQRYIYDATRTHYLIGRKHLIRNLAPPAHGTVLEIGCGTAWNLVQVARTYPSVRCHGLDVSRAMLRTAASNVARKGLERRILLAQGDATQFSAQDVFGRATFDRVFFSYALTMIPGWKAALEQGIACVAPSGSLHIVDFGQCERLPVTVKRALEAFLAHYTVYPRTDLETVLGEVGARHDLELRIEKLHLGYTVHAVLRHN